MFTHFTDPNGGCNRSWRGLTRSLALALCLALGAGCSGVEHGAVSQSGPVPAAVAINGGDGSKFGPAEPLVATDRRESGGGEPASAGEVSTKAGTIFMIPGIVGQPSDLSGMRDGLRDAIASAHIHYEVEIIPWETSALQPIRNLTDYEANKVRARRIAERLTAASRNSPERELILVGNSGGGGLAVMAVEMLPEDVMLDRLILTAAAVSNDYDLSLVRSRCRVIENFYSRADGIVGWGTSLFGTIDRKNTLSAGHTGFIDGSGNLLKADRLRQHEWRIDWLKYGHSGSHLGYRARKWAEVVLAPRVIGETESIRTASAN